MDTSIEPDSPTDRIEEIRSRMKEKRKVAAKLAGMNGSWNKSFGKKRRCPNASVLLKVSLKSNNRALAKSVQNLKHENRQAQDMIIDLQNEQQVLLQSFYKQKQTEKENMRIRKEIQTALNEVTSSLLMAGTKLAYAMELTTSFPVRDSLLRASSVAMSSDDDSIYMKNRPSSLGPSVYYRKPKSAGGVAPVSPPVNEKASEKSNAHRVPSPGPSLSVPPKDEAPMETVKGGPLDPEEECLDPSMIKELDFDIPLMFTDDDVFGKVDEAVSDEDGPSIKRRTRSSRTSGLIDLASSKAALNSKPTGSKGTSSRINSGSANPQNRATFVIDEHMKGTQDSRDDHTSAVEEEEKAEKTSNVLNQTFEIEEKSVEKSNCNEKSNPGEKTSHKVVDMELTTVTHAESSTNKNQNDINEQQPVEESCQKKKMHEGGHKKSDLNVAKKKSKLPLKKAKTKVSLKKKDKQDTFQSPKSPLMSPGVSRSTNGLSFRCVPSPVFGKTSKREPVPSQSQERADMSLGSVFDLSAGDTFTAPKSVVPPSKETILECCDKIEASTEESTMEKDKINEERQHVDQVDQKKSHPSNLKSSKSKIGKRKHKTSNARDNKMAGSTLPNTREQSHDSDNGEATGTEIDKGNRKTKKTKSVASSGESKTLLQKVSNDKGETENQKKGAKKKKSLYFPFEEEDDSASSFFITKPMIHKKKKDDKNKSGASKNGATVESGENGDSSKADISDFLKDIDAVLQGVKSQQEKEKNMKRKKKRSSIPILQNKSIMASRLDAAMMPFEDKTESGQEVKQTDQMSDKLDEHCEISQQEQAKCQTKRPEQGNDKLGEQDKVVDPTETAQVEERRDRRSRLSSGSPVIQRVNKSRKRRCRIESESDDKSGDEDCQEDENDSDEDYKPQKQYKKTAKAAGRKRCRVSFDVEGRDEAIEPERQVLKKSSKRASEKQGKSSKSQQQKLMIAGENQTAKKVDNNQVQHIDVKAQREENTDAAVVNNRQIKHCIKKRSSIGQKKKEPIRNSTAMVDVVTDKVDVDSEQKMSMGSRRTSRRAAGVVSYKEPSLGGKLRRGDAHTSNDYLTQSEIYKDPAEKRTLKQKRGEKRKPLGNVQNIIEDLSCEERD